MRNICELYSPTNNFWEQCPQFTTIQPFKKLYSSDKSRGKKVSSDLMWAIALIHHPKSDMFYIPMKEERLAIDMLKVKKSDVDQFWEDNAVYVDAMKEAILTQAQKSLIAWEEGMKDRDRFLKEQRYHFGYTNEDGVEFKSNAKDLDDMRSKTGKMYDEYFKIQKSLEEQDVKGNNNNGYDADEVEV